MSNPSVRLLPVLFLLAHGTLNLLAQQFMADLVRTKPEGAAASRLRVSGDKMRLESIGPQKGGVVVLDLKEGSGFMAIPEQKTYSLLSPRQISPTTPFFRPSDPENACEAWDKFVGKPGSCTKIGDESLNGRQVVKYKGVARNGDPGYAWVDRNLKFVVKWDGKATACELRDIKLTSQPPAFFEIPKDYLKMDSIADRKTAGKKPVPKNASPKPNKQ